MAKVQTRRSVSLNRELYDEARDAADGAGVPLAQFVEHALRAVLSPPVAAAPSAGARANTVPDPDRSRIDEPPPSMRPAADPVVEYDT